MSQTNRVPITLPPPHHMAIAVSNLEVAIDGYRNILGIVAWELIEVKPADSRTPVQPRESPAGLSPGDPDPDRSGTARWDTKPRPGGC